VVWFAPGEKHCHGATPSTAMTHIAIQEQLDGKVVDWLEHVSDEQYRSRRPSNCKSATNLHRLRQAPSERPIRSPADASFERTKARIS
jgi:hypothetical protein